MNTPRPRGSRRYAIVFLALVMVVSGFSSTFIPSAERIAQAKNADALGDTLILAGPGGQYGILTVAPAGSVLSVDGDPVDGYYPVTYEGISGWTAVGLIQVGNNGGGGNGGGGGGNGGNGGGNSSSGDGGVEVVSADPVYSDSGAPVEVAPSEPVEAAPSEASASNAEPVTGGAYGPGGSGYSEQQIVDIIHEAADNYGQPRDDMVRVARCESGLNPNAVGGGGAYHGLFQFVPVTFAETPYGQYDIYDPWANANAAAWMWSEGGRGEWVCQ